MHYINSANVKRNVKCDYCENTAVLYYFGIYSDSNNQFIPHIL